MLCLIRLEIAARSIVSGFLFDPDLSVGLTGMTGSDAGSTARERPPPSQMGVILGRYHSIRKRFLPSETAQKTQLSNSTSSIARHSHIYQSADNVRPSAQARKELHLAQKWRSKNNIGNIEKAALNAGHHRRNRTIGKTGIFTEMPFERAIERQKGMIKGARPFMRHSWQ